jgi:hypothetical protein
MADPAHDLEKHKSISLQKGDISVKIALSMMFKFLQK